MGVRWVCERGRIRVDLVTDFVTDLGKNKFRGLEKIKYKGRIEERRGNIK